MINDFRPVPGVCKLSETDPGHNRTRSSILVEWDGFSSLIDVSADFRQQVLRESVKKIDSVLITHGHADHVTGIPDIRSYTREKPVPLYGSEESVDMIRKSYSYVFEYPPCTGGGIPQLITNKVDSPFYLSDQKVIPVLVGHGDLKGCFGYRIGPLAYIPDMRTIDDENLKKLEGTEILVLMPSKEKEHPTHLICPRALSLQEGSLPGGAILFTCAMIYIMSLIRGISIHLWSFPGWFKGRDLIGRLSW